MVILAGKKPVLLSRQALLDRVAGRSVHMDIGTGSGRFVLKNAAKDPGGFYIGLDPAAAQMAENAVKAQKNKLSNTLFVVASAEAPPEELAGAAGAVTVCLPWGRLRDGVVKADPAVLNGLRLLGGASAALTVWVGYDERREAAELQRHGLPPLSEAHFFRLAGAYRDAGIELQSVSAVGNAELRALESDWAKRLAYGPPRRMYRLYGMYI